jgi:MFS transporter, FSR family, fosmidomycin resistance protein
LTIEDATMTMAAATNGQDAPARRRRAAATISVHSIVDFFSFIIIALMPLLAVRLDMSGPDKALLIGVGSVTSGLIQPMVAWLSDRHDTRVLGTIGVAVAVICISSIGFAETFWQLMILQAVGAAGIGAFHPVSAAAIGELAGRWRSRYVAAFFLAGMIGGFSGNAFAPLIVEGMSVAGGTGGESDIVAGLHGLLWLLIPGAFGVLLLAWAIHGISHRDAGAHAQHASLSPEERTLRWRAVWILYAGNVIRFTVNMALIYLIVEWTTQLTAERAVVGTSDEALGLIASQLNGPLQGAEQVGMGLGGLALGMLLPMRHEKKAFCIIPWLGAIAIALIPLTARLPDAAVVPVAFAVTALAGLGFGSLVPVSISLAQRLLPHRTSLASGLMMGGAWMLAFVGPMFAGAMQTWFGLETAFLATGGLLCVAGVLTLFLPSSLLRVSHG